MRKVYKYATGEKIPEDAVYLHTEAHTAKGTRYDVSSEIRLVWHYFLVEIED